MPVSSSSFLIRRPGLLFLSGYFKLLKAAIHSRLCASFPCIFALINSTFKCSPGINKHIVYRHAKMQVGSGRKACASHFAYRISLFYPVVRLHIQALHMIIPALHPKAMFNNHRISRKLKKIRKQNPSRSSGGHLCPRSQRLCQSRCGG